MNFKTMILIAASLVSLKATPPCQHETSVAFRGGSVMDYHITKQIIFYGDFSGVQSGTKDLFHDFVKNIHRSTAWNPIANYCDGSGNYVASSWLSHTMNSDIDVSSSTYGTTPSLYDIQSVIDTAVTSFGSDQLMVIVILAPNVTIPNCTGCGGFHGTYKFGSPTTSTLRNPADVWIRYAVIRTDTYQNVGNPNYPNGNAMFDGVVQVVYHEMAETATDPVFDGWNEIADACQEANMNLFVALDANGATITINSPSDISTGTGYFYGYRGYWVRPLWSNSQYTPDTCSLTQ